MGHEVDPLVVRTEELAQHVDRWVEKYERQHPARTGSAFSADRLNGFGGCSFLAQEMGATTTKLSASAEYRQVIVVKNRVHKYTELRVADAILTAMGEVYKLTTEIKIIHNPKLKPETVKARLRAALC